MTKQRPLRKHTCESCSRNFFSRSPLSRYCSVQCQVREWRARNKTSPEQLEVEFNAQQNEQHGEVA